MKAPSPSKLLSVVEFFQALNRLIEGTPKEVRPYVAEAYIRGWNAGYDQGKS